MTDDPGPDTNHNDELYMDAVRGVTVTPEERFWAKVNLDGPTQSHMDTPCWVWTASCSKGYGTLTVKVLDRWQKVLAHRFAYELLVGLIPSGLDLCHHCDHPPCVNPDHLFAGTRDDNMKDAVRKGRHSHGEMLPQSVLTETEVEQIRERFLAGERQRPLAKAFGVSQANISHITRGTTWRHLL